MKTSKIVKLIGIVLIGLFFATQVEAKGKTGVNNEKKAVTLTVDKPIIEFLAKAYGDEINAEDIVRIQKMLGQIDHITVTFTDKDAVDYVLKFKPIDGKQLEAWMFEAGYLSEDYQVEPEVVVPWMDNMHLD